MNEPTKQELCEMIDELRTVLETIAHSRQCDERIEERYRVKDLTYRAWDLTRRVPQERVG